MTDMPSSAPHCAPALSLNITIRSLKHTQRYERVDALIPFLLSVTGVLGYQNIRGAKRVSSRRQSTRWISITLLYLYAFPNYMLSFLDGKQQEGPSAWVGLQIKGDDRLAKGSTRAYCRRE